MDETTDLTGHFLIAMPALDDPNFYHTVTLICQHNEDGAMGVIFNRPLEIDLGEVFKHMEIEAADNELEQELVYYGGPVQVERGFVLHMPDGDWESTMPISDELAVTTSRDIIDDIAQSKGPEKYLIALGYAGWQAGQLEYEISENAWLSGPSNADIIFDTPFEKRWESAASIIGVDLNLISGDMGHA